MILQLLALAYASKNNEMHNDGTRRTTLCNQFTIAELFGEECIAKLIDELISSLDEKDANLLSDLLCVLQWKIKEHQDDNMRAKQKLYTDWIRKVEALLEIK